MNRTHRYSHDNLELPAAHFVVPAVLWAVAFVVAVMGAPKYDSPAAVIDVAANEQPATTD